MTFVHFQEAFCSMFILRHFDSQLLIQLEINTFNFAFAEIFSQQFQNQNSDETIWHSMIYWSRKITDVETCYKIYDEKLFTIIISFKHW